MTEENRAGEAILECRVPCAAPEEEGLPWAFAGRASDYLYGTHKNFNFSSKKKLAQRGQKLYR